VDEVTGGWRKLHNEELYNLYSSPSIIRMILAGHVARMLQKKNAYRILAGKPEGKRPLRRPRRRGWTILKWILERQDVKVWTGLVWLRIVTNGGLL
jgi:hypothetical protein